MRPRVLRVAKVHASKCLRHQMSVRHWQTRYFSGSRASPPATYGHERDLGLREQVAPVGRRPVAMARPRAPDSRVLLRLPSAGAVRIPTCGDAVHVFDGSSCTSSPHAIVGVGGQGFLTTHTRRGSTPPSRVLGPPLCPRMSWMACQRPPAPRYCWRRRAWVLDDAPEGRHHAAVARVGPPSVLPYDLDGLPAATCRYIRSPLYTFHAACGVGTHQPLSCQVRGYARSARGTHVWCGSLSRRPGQHGMPTRGGDHRQRGSFQCDGVSPGRPWTPSRPIGPRAPAPICTTGCRMCNHRF